MDRFWNKVKVSGESDCWEWQASLDTRGYGLFRFKGKLKKAHRFSWEVLNGSIERGLCICHKCDNPKCVNPNHLFLGTPRDNALDREAKNRGVVPRGETHHKAKLKWADVETIRELYATGKYTLAQLGREYAVGATTVYKIVQKVIWKVGPRGA